MQKEFQHFLRLAVLGVIFIQMVIHSLILPAQMHKDHVVEFSDLGSSVKIGPQILQDIVDSGDHRLVADLKDFDLFLGHDGDYSDKRPNWTLKSSQICFKPMASIRLFVNSDWRIFSLSVKNLFSSSSLRTFSWISDGIWEEVSSFLSLFRSLTVSRI